MKTRTPLNYRCLFSFFVTILLIFAATPAFATLNITYERVVYDSNGNEIGYRKQQITSLTDLPKGNAWRTYLSKMIGTRTYFDYLKEVSGSLSQPLNVTISDRDLTSASSKTSSGYNIKLYKHVTQYSSASNQRFVLLHEIGHIAMLNSYPSSYNFKNLNYGSDNAHYMDEILPNTNTAWVEGWANAFAALKNNGMVFSTSLNSDTATAFLQNNTFEEMNRNELFVGKMLYDIMSTFSSGKNKVYNAIAKTGPHSSLQEFCQGYLSLYPNDQDALIELLKKNSCNKATEEELLKFVGKETLWSRVKNFFAKLFNFGSSESQSAVSAQPTTGVANETFDSSVTDYVPYGQVLFSTALSSNAAMSPSVTAAATATTQSSDQSKNIITAQEEYFKAFNEYNKILTTKTPDSPEVKTAKDRLVTAKSNIESLRKGISVQNK